MSEDDSQQKYETESFSHEDKLQMKCLGSHQLQDVVLNRTADVQQLLVIKEDFPSVWSLGLEQDRDLESIHIKEEQEKLWTSQDGEKLIGIEESHCTRFLSTAVVKSEDDEEEL